MSDVAKPVPVEPTPTADDAPRTRTGIRVQQLVEDVKADLSDIQGFIRQARERAAQLEEEARGINGLSSACRGWGQQLDRMIIDLDEEREEVERLMLGSGRSISQSVDQSLRQRLRIAREA